MNANRVAKAEEIKAIKDGFANATSSVMVSFSGLSVEKATELRDEFRKADVVYRVVKNTLVRQALKDDELGKSDEFAKHLIGPTAVAWSGEDPAAAARIIKAFRKDEENATVLEVKCAILADQLLPASDVETKLATMPTLNEARAQLLATLMAPAEGLVRQLNAAGQKLALALNARKEQLENS